jgi:hypothetical protein
MYICTYKKSIYYREMNRLHVSADPFFSAMPLYTKGFRCRSSKFCYHKSDSLHTNIVRMRYVMKVDTAIKTALKAKRWKFKTWFYGVWHMEKSLIWSIMPIKPISYRVLCSIIFYSSCLFCCQNSFVNVIILRVYEGYVDQELINLFVVAYILYDLNVCEFSFNMKIHLK